ncbi:MAG: hypothetical protein V3U02_04115 [Calditrichia bacterium]
MDAEYWICGKTFKDLEMHKRWEFAGVFDDKKKAIKACLSRDYFIGPAKLNDVFHDGQRQWPGAYYPLCQNT